MRVVRLIFGNTCLFLKPYVSRSSAVLKYSVCTALQQRYSISVLKYHLPWYRNFSSSKYFLCSNTFEHTSEASGTSQVLGKVQPKLLLAFTCKVCKSRIEKHISKLAYTKGVVIVRCDGCEENHLIADNLNWFPNLKSMRNIEDIMAAQGETVKKSLNDSEIKES